MTNIRRQHPLLILCLSLPLICVGAPAAAQSESAESLVTPRLPAANSPLETPAASGQYVIGSDDVVSITVRQAPELNAIARVADNGAISLPLLGEMMVARQTTQQV